MNIAGFCRPDSCSLVPISNQDEWTCSHETKSHSPLVNGGKSTRLRLLRQVINTGSCHEGSYITASQYSGFILVTATSGQCQRGDFPPVETTGTDPLHCQFPHRSRRKG